MICINEDHYPTDRPLTDLTLDPRLHFPDEHGPECIDREDFIARHLRERQRIEQLFGQIHAPLID